MRPDIVYIVSLLSQFMAAFMALQASAAKRAIRYMRHTAKHGLIYQGNNNAIIGYSDSDYANDLQYARSTTGYIFTLNRTAISWKSRRQTTTATAA